MQENLPRVRDARSANQRRYSSAASGQAKHQLRSPAKDQQASSTF